MGHPADRQGLSRRIPRKCFPPRRLRDSFARLRETSEQSCFGFAIAVVPFSLEIIVSVLVSQIQRMLGGATDTERGPP